MKKKSYIRGDVPNRIVEDPIVEHLDGGLILDLPDEDVEAYVKSQVDLKWMPSDDDLVNYLEC
jgi:hypothetical protein